MDNPSVKNASEIESIRDRGFFWYSKEMIGNLDFFNSGDETDSVQESSTVSSSEIVSDLSQKGIHSYVVDITPPEIRAAGFDVVKIIMPELHPLFLYEDFPCLHSGRLRENLRGRKLNTLPHPFM